MKKKNRYPVPACFNSAADYLEFLVMEGAMEVKRYGTLLPFCVIQGIRREMAFIRENDLADFFLYLYNIAGYLQSEDILIGPGRGDSSASLVCFCLGLTTVDPVRNELDPVGFLQLPVTVNVDIGSRPSRVWKYVENRFGPSVTKELRGDDAPGAPRVMIRSRKILRLISDASRMVRERNGIIPRLERIPLDDPAILDLFREGRTDLVYSFWKPEIRDSAVRNRVESFADLVAVNADAHAREEGIVFNADMVACTLLAWWTAWFLVYYPDEYRACFDRLEENRYGETG